VDLPHLRMAANDAEILAIAQRKLQAAVLAFDGLEL
jgi:hypothetical protein